MLITCAGVGFHGKFWSTFFLPGRKKNIHFYIEMIIPTTEEETEGRREEDLCLRFIKSSSNVTDVVRNVNDTDGLH